MQLKFNLQTALHSSRLIVVYCYLNRGPPGFRMVGPYNFDSIMHYAFDGVFTAKRGHLPKHAGSPRDAGQRDQFDVTDIAMVNAEYP